MVLVCSCRVQDAGPCEYISIVCGLRVQALFIALSTRDEQASGVNFTEGFSCDKLLLRIVNIFTHPPNLPFRADAHDVEKGLMW